MWQQSWKLFRVHEAGVAMVGEPIVPIIGRPIGYEVVDRNGTTLAYVPDVSRRTLVEIVDGPRPLAMTEPPPPLRVHVRVDTEGEPLEWIKPTLVAKRGTFVRVNSGGSGPTPGQEKSRTPEAPNGPLSLGSNGIVGAGIATPAYV